VQDYVLKKDEIYNRIQNNIVLTPFGEKIGCEVEEIAFVLEKMNNKEIIWDKIMKNEHIKKYYN